MTARTVLPMPSLLSVSEGARLAEVRGKTIPRLFTPPLIPSGPSECPCGVCGHTPETTDGFDFIDFNRDVLASPLDLWQQFVSVHALERLDDGRPRFRHVLVLVGRQNGKTEIPVRLSLFWQFVDEVPLILGTSTKLDYAKESWIKAVQLAEKAPGLPITRADRRKWTRQANGEQESWNTTADGMDCRYKIAPANEEGGRSLTVHRLILDELRQHKTYQAWGAAVNAGNAVRDFQAWALSNQGDATSVVLNDKRRAALEFIETGKGDYRLGLFEYSAPEGADPTDLEALACANPSLGYRMDPEVPLGDARAAVAAGGEALATFKIEVMCQAVTMLDPAVDEQKWLEAENPGTLDGHRARVAGCLDISPDGLHATLAAAAVVDEGIVRVEVVEAWSGTSAVEDLRAALPGWIKRVRPKSLGWFPGGPAAALAADLGKRKDGEARSPLEVALRRKPEAIRADVAAVCMGFAADVKAGRIVQSGDELLTTHVTGSEKLKTGDTWRFSRRGVGHCDAAYAAAGAAHLARLIPVPVRRGRIIRSSDGAA
jgi:hypothetical protein